MVSFFLKMTFFKNDPAVLEKFSNFRWGLAWYDLGFFKSMCSCTRAFQDLLLPPGGLTYFECKNFLDQIDQLIFFAYVKACKNGRCI